jgi:hypothetical protein
MESTIYVNFFIPLTVYFPYKNNKLLTGSNYLKLCFQYINRVFRLFTSF